MTSGASQTAYVDVFLILLRDSGRQALTALRGPVSWRRTCGIRWFSCSVASEEPRGHCEPCASMRTSYAMGSARSLMLPVTRIVHAMASLRDIGREKRYPWP
jgi:hypothetical protein